MNNKEYLTRRFAQMLSAFDLSDNPAVREAYCAGVATGAARAREQLFEALPDLDKSAREHNQLIVDTMAFSGKDPTELINILRQNDGLPSKTTEA